MSTGKDSARRWRAKAALSQPAPHLSSEDIEGYLDIVSGEYFFDSELLILTGKVKQLFYSHLPAVKLRA